VFVARDRWPIQGTLLEHEHDHEHDHGMVKVKVCGITRIADAERALELGADFLGFNFYSPSPRCVSPETAAGILAQLPAWGGAVALFVNEPRARVLEVIERGRAGGQGRGYGYLQFHGEESGAYCRGWPCKVIKAFRMQARDSLARLSAYPAEFFLLDSFSAGYGGSGTSFPWEWLEGVSGERLILSGGLTVDNVAAAVQRIGPYGVDVCSGVESRPGIKDHGKLKEFIIAAKTA
jgi:phosphoribosylanthranilate isomerase